MVIKTLSELSDNIASGISTYPLTKNGIYPRYGSTGIIGFSDKFEYEGTKILVARVGANAGRLNFVTGKYGVSDNALIIDVLEGNDAKYIFYQLDAMNLNKLIFGSGQPLITGNQLKELRIIYFSSHEQTAIAAALSDTDALIESLEKLIAKKQAIKQGAMQELLTGKRRLKGFSGKWEYRKFVDTFEFLPNNIYARNQMTDSNGKYINIHYGDVLIKYGAVLDLERDEVPFLKNGIKITNKKMLAQDGDIIIADTAEDNTVGKMIELFHVGNRKVVAGLHTILCRPKYEEFSPCWLGYFMNSTTYHNQLLPFITGIKVSSIAKNNIGETMIAIPNKHEQAAIAQILTDMDSEISALQKKLDKVRRIKQGMMAELLTGRIRLKEV